VKLSVPTEPTTAAAAVLLLLLLLLLLLRRTPHEDRSWRGSRLLPYPLLLLGKHVLVAALLKLAFGEQVESPPQLHVESAKRRVVGRVSEIAYCVERLFDAECVVRPNVPFLLLLGQQSPRSY
jgi:MYXO-CTERM domain-containing protein